jgi:hypothetical protein
VGWGKHAFLYSSASAFLFHKNPKQKFSFPFLKKLGGARPACRQAGIEKIERNTFSNVFFKKSSSFVEKPYQNQTLRLGEEFLKVIHRVEYGQKSIIVIEYHRKQFI